MIIKGKPLSPILAKCGAYIIGWFLRRRYHKVIIRPIEIKPGHAYLLMCNHFSFLDGFLAHYLSNKVIRQPNGMKHMFIMVLKKQMQKNKWLRYFGCFSVDPGKRSVGESFDHAVKLLDTPGNLLLFYPQGNLESCHIRTIHFETGINEIITNIKGNCQLIWCSNIVEYFESTKPSLYLDMLDCGTNTNFDFEALKKKVNQHHRESMEKNIRFTQEKL